MSTGHLQQNFDQKAQQGFDPDLVHERNRPSHEDRQQEFDDNISKGGDDIARDAGRIGTARSAQEQVYNRAQDDKKKRNEAARTAGDIILENMRKLQNDLDGLLEDLAEIRRQQEANNRLVSLLESGQFDRNNVEHAELIIAAGLDQSMDDDALQEAAKDQKAGLAAREGDIRTDIQRKQEDVAKEAAKAPDDSRVQKFLEQSNADVSAALRIQGDVSEAVIEAAVVNNSVEGDYAAVSETEINPSVTSVFGTPSP